MVEIPKNFKIYNCSIPHDLTCIRTLGTFGNYIAEIKDKTTRIDIEIEPHQLLFSFINSVQSFSLKLTVDKKRYVGDLFVTHLVWKKEHHTITTTPKKKKKAYSGLFLVAIIRNTIIGTLYYKKVAYSDDFLVAFL